MLAFSEHFFADETQQSWKEYEQIWLEDFQ